MLVTEFIEKYEEIHDCKIDKECFVQYIIKEYIDPSDCYWILDYMLDNWTGLGTEDVTEALLYSLDSVLSDSDFETLLDYDFE